MLLHCVNRVTGPSAGRTGKTVLDDLLFHGLLIREPEAAWRSSRRVFLWDDSEVLDPNKVNYASNKFWTPKGITLPGYLGPFVVPLEIAQKLSSVLHPRLQFAIVNSRHSIDVDPVVASHAMPQSLFAEDGFDESAWEFMLNRWPAQDETYCPCVVPVSRVHFKEEEAHVAVRRSHWTCSTIEHFTRDLWKSGAPYAIAAEIAQAVEDVGLIVFAACNFVRRDVLRIILPHLHQRMFEVQDIAI